MTRLDSEQHPVVIVGGGAAGMFAAAVCAGIDPACPVLVLERNPQTLAKVRLSGGGRCNLTHQCEDIRSFCEHYPRGGKALIGPCHRFGPAETRAWFKAQGLLLVTEADGRVFPRQGGAEAVVDVLASACGRGRVRVLTDCRVQSAVPDRGGFSLSLADGHCLAARVLLIAAGGGAWLAGLEQHTLEPWAPSLFSLRIADEAFTALAGIAVPQVRLTCLRRRVTGALLITHEGVSGPAVLDCSSILARELAAAAYRVDLRVHWAPDRDAGAVRQSLGTCRAAAPRKAVVGDAQFSIPLRLWRLLCARAGVPPTRSWSEVTAQMLDGLTAQICGSVLKSSGRAPNRDEFVTCGGLRLAEVDFKTMASRRYPGLFLAGEVLDIDGLTGGYNLQAAWTTGWLAAQGMLAFKCLATGPQ